jgi:6-phosphogluconolactonase (cycloisomerase 2 family)
MFARKFRIDSKPASIQQLLPHNRSQRFEGVAFSPGGDILGAATADTNAVQLFRRKAGGRFEDAAYSTITDLNYPHDLSFAKCGDKVLLAIAERSGAISVLEDRGNGMFGPDPTFVISGAGARLSHTDGVAFVPPHNRYLAACNLLTGVISFYRRASDSPVEFSTSPDVELSHVSMVHPDGLDFSTDGRWLAVANHAANSVSVFQRKGADAANGEAPNYDPEPIAVITDPDLRHPHSVAFTAYRHLIATSAGANYFTVYRTSRSFFQKSAEPEVVHKQLVADDSVFRAVNEKNKMEGGPKGIAVHKHTLAICSPEIGIKLYSFRG